MTRPRGWAPKGERLVDKVPHGRWKTATFLAALRNDRIDALCLFDGPIKLPRLCRTVPHADPQAGRRRHPRQSRRPQGKGGATGHPSRRGAPRVPAKYSPDINAIEPVFAKFKTLLRKAEARTYDASATASAKILAQYGPEECAAYVRTQGTRKAKCRALSSAADRRSFYQRNAAAVTSMNNRPALGHGSAAAACPDREAPLRGTAKSQSFLWKSRA